ncbi:hypothetical protein VE03_07019 [Pseudogymnoascus sp. 23342-1-I1]|nr:hypothetical protein VE03_07019 [Pseudogymnoascus sp. 23342-1-I1]
MSESSTSEDGDQLSDTLKRSLVESEFDKTCHEFVPNGVLNRVITPRSILTAMKITQPTGEDNELISFILTKATKLFAILSFIELKKSREAMLIFKDTEFDDTNLPIKDTLSNSSSGGSSGGDSNHTSEATESVLVSLERRANRGKIKIWRRHSKVYDFYRDQWKFLVPVFSTNKSNLYLQEAYIIPFVVKHSNFEEGSFGQVYKYEIHADHLIDPLRPTTRGPCIFAVKEIKPKTQEERQKVAQHWATEAKALAKMNALNQDHIVRFITAFCRLKKNEREHYLVFEWADGGNLRDLWRSRPRLALTASLAKAVVKQLLGLTRALCAAHYLDETGSSYRHGDLKPANILRFLDGGEVGTLKIGDWGEAKEHNLSTELRTSKTTAEYGTRRYEAPEVKVGLCPTDKGQVQGRRSRLYDIWAMGCITIEFIVWLLYGPDGLDRFNQEVKEESSADSPFYQTSTVNGNKVAKVHSAVVHWMDNMAQNAACQIGTTALGDLLDLVRGGLLVVKLPRRMGSNLLAIDSHQPHLNPASTQFELESNPSDDASALQNLPTSPRLLAEGEGIPSIRLTPSIESSPVETIRASTEPEPKPKPEPEPEGPARLLAPGFRQRLENILSDDRGERYWLTDQPKLPPPPPPPSLIGPPSVPDHDRTEHGMSTTISSHTALTLRPSERIRLDDDWKIEVDNEFASNLFSNLKTTGSFCLPEAQGPRPQLCVECLALRNKLCAPGFSITYNVQELEARSRSNGCNLCGLFWRTCQQNRGAAFTTVKFDSFDSSLRMNGGGVPVLSMFWNPNVEARAANNIQLGFAELPEAGNSIHLGVIRQWLRDCDTKHGHSTCQPPKQKGTTRRKPALRLPTRLIDVGVIGGDKVHLWETGPRDTGEWIALSHKWGDVPHFSTNTKNLKDHIAGIKYETLPGTFKDAVTVTRDLGRRYLWIDSMCIIQGKGGDFNQEANRMEDVYSGAYCVLAASRATGHFSGFLQPHKERDYVVLSNEAESNKSSYYVCRAIDNFKEHVLEGALNRRGWVLQEHALARRTIFFTEHQTYWECGNGVRCETMTKMNNNLATLLGDPNFPEILLDAPQGERILRYQELYRKYSRLELFDAWDRPTAIDGLQQRLLRVMNVRGGFGVFDDGATKGLLRRSLLWHRRPDTSRLSRIAFPADRVIATVPSWSWMAYTGGIDYFEMAFGGVEWESLGSPWSRRTTNVSRAGSGSAKSSIALTAEARAYDPNAALEGEGELILDSPGGSEQRMTLCVVLGIQKGAVPVEEKLHYLLLVVATSNHDSDGNELYERVGAGYLPGRCIARRGSTVSIH